MFLAAIILVVAFVYLFFRGLTLPKCNESTDSTWLPDTGLTCTHQTLLQKSTLEESAAPNQRLVQVFGIDNAFTTTDRTNYKIFVADVRAKLMTTNDEWKVLAHAVDTNIGSFLEVHEASAGPVNLINLVQTIVFKTVMLKFFPQHPVASDSDIRAVTTQINKLWLSSKDEVYLTSMVLFEDRRDLDANLHRIFGSLPNQHLRGSNNPLNIVLPAYETLWRIVLRLFLEIRFRGSSDVRYRQFIPILTFFLTEPGSSIDVQDFAPPLYDTGDIVDEHTSYTVVKVPSMKDIVNEGLRLYPPTRRIYRRVNGNNFAVDVEALHRDPRIWGDESLKFRPSRFMDIKPRSSNFLPFGSGMFECPAKGSFGPIMIGVIVATLALRVGKSYQLSGCGAEEVMADKEPLCNGRAAFEGLCIEKLPKF